MRNLTLITLLFTACGGDKPASYDCDTLIRAVTQRHGTCRLDYDQHAIFMDGCPAAMGAYCGDIANCPIDGWSPSCDETPGGYTNCTYDSGSPCTVVEPNKTVEIDYVQTLNGVDGLSILVEASAPAWKCEFRPCSPL